MKAIIFWVLAHPELVSSVVLMIVSIIVCCIKKKPVKVVDTLKEKILFELPTVMLTAEKKFGAGHGEEKLKFVLDYFTWLFNEEGLVMGESYIKFIKLSVESILSTPQKKER